MRALSLVLVLAVSSLAASVMAQPLPQDDVPTPLRPWIDWALDGDRSHECAWLGSSRECEWPGSLALDLSDSGGSFTLEVLAGAPTDMRLPGGPGIFPVDVRVGGRPQPLTRDADGVGHVHLERGTHRITGRFEVMELPELLLVPQEIALVTLRLDGQVASVRRNDGGDLWLRPGSDGPVTEEESTGLQLEVHRLLTDGTPFTVITRITVRASGEPREVALGEVLLRGTTPTSLRSDLAARLDPETGELTIQARPGNFELTLVAQLGTPPESLAAPEQSEPWPSQEIWVWSPSEALRQVQVDGAPAIDRARVDLPGAWDVGSVYALASGAALTFETTRRGEVSPELNEVSLRRELWLDFDGVGYTASDAISGRMNQGFRLDLTEGELGRLAIGGDDQVITELDGKRGVEMRERTLSVSADLRFPDATSSLPAVGWSEDVSLGTALHLPPGWTLLTATGVDEVSGTWLDQWDLWSIFFVLVMSLAIARLSNVPIGLLTLVTLTLCYHEPGAPFVSWMLLVPLLGLRRVIPAGIFQKGAAALLWSSFVLLVWVATPFGVAQIRNALYPFMADADLGWAGSELNSPPVTWDEEEPEWLQEESSAEDGMMGRSEARSSARYGIEGPTDAPAESDDRQRADWLDPNAVAQTGPGVPTWRHRVHELSWTGPVRADHRITLHLVPPWVYRLLALLRVLLLGGLIMLLLSRHVPTPPPARKKDEGDAPPDEARPPAATGATATAAAVTVALLGVLAPSPLAAQVPSAEQLTELAERLRRGPECGDECVLVTDATVTVDGDDGLHVTIEAHASARVGLRLPGPATRWVPDSVRVDGRLTTALMRDGDNSLFVRIDEGVHRVELDGRVRGDALTLGLGEEPARVRVSAEGWSIDGVRPDGSASETIELQRRVRVESDESEAAEDAELPSWLMVRRRLELGVRWTMVTEVQRDGGSGASTVLRLPLLEGESVTDANVRLEEGVLSVTVRGDRPVTWTSTLEPSGSLALVAGEGQRYSEVWSVACSPIWRCEAEGVAPVELGHARVVREYHPWPGERLTLTTSRPPGAEGRSRTVQRATLALSPGVRMLAARLDVEVRASHGETQTIGLPEGAAIQSLQVDGARRPVQLAGDGTLAVNLPPGMSTVAVEWQQPGGLEVFFEAPEVRLEGAMVNARVSIEVPRDRWILWAHGPGSGVAVLFWPYLLLMLGLAIALGRSKRTPLGAVEWFLLGIGLTQVPALAAVIVVGWFFLLELRARTPKIHKALFTLRQLALVGYTVVAAGCLYAALHIGLLMQPDMQVTSLEAGPDQFAWYVDRATDVLPSAGVWSAPLWVWRITMLVWALWLALRLFKWGKWGWESFSVGGWITGGVAPPRAAAAAAAATSEPQAATQAESDGEANVVSE